MYAFKGDSIVLTNIGSLASVTIEARAVLLGPKGKPDEVSTGIITAQSDRTLSSGDQSSQRFKHDGNVVSAHIRVVSGSPVRGQVFGVLRIRDGAELCRGYLTTEQGANLGTFESSLDGRGHTSWRIVSDDIAPVDVAESLAATNTFRRVFGSIWYYVASVDAGTRVMTMQIRGAGSTKPTGYTQTAIMVNIASTLSLTPSQQGFVYGYKGPGGGDAIGMFNDNDAALSIQPTTTVPMIWPLEVEENDLIDIFYNSGVTNANDRMSIYILQEEWLLA